MHHSNVFLLSIFPINTGNTLTPSPERDYVCPDLEELPNVIRITQYDSCMQMRMWMRCSCRT